MEKMCSLSPNDMDLSGCFWLGLSIVEWATVIGGLAIITGLVKWVIKAQSGGSLPKIKSFRALCREIEPLLDDNTRIFRTFGPNSGKGDGLPKIVRTDLTAWEDIRHQIADNNSEIKNLLNSGQKLIPSDYHLLFQRWISHIDAFNAHLGDPDVDYREHQFPTDVIGIIRKNA